MILAGADRLPTPANDNEPHRDDRPGAADMPLETEKEDQ